MYLSFKIVKPLLSFALILLCFVAIIPHLQAQDFNLHNPITIPDKSQESLARQRIGYTDISILYHSPATRGRAIWGDLVPFGRVWRAGANENTVFTITDEVKIGGETLPAGSYGLHLLPEKDQWTFIFSKNHTSWGSYFYNPEEDALRVTVPVEKAPEYRDWMSFDFHQKARGVATIYLTWGDLRAGFEIDLAIDQLALENIRLQLRSDAYWEWFSWCQAADYCAQYEINTEEALEWIDRSIAMQENFSNLDVKAKLLRQKGQKSAAEEVMARAVEVGVPLYLERYGRRLMRQGNPQEAIFVFNQAIKKDASFWRAHFNLGNALEATGKTKAAQKAFKKAVEFAPAANKAGIKKKIQ